MKKKLLIIAVVILSIILVILVIFGITTSHKLVCTSSEDNNFLKVDTKLNIRYRYNKIYKINMSMKYDIKEIKYKDAIIESIKLSYDKYNNEKWFISNLEENNNKIIYTMNINAKSVNIDTIKELGFGDGKDYKDSKKSLKSLGYSCE